MSANIHLFILCPPYSGSSVLWQLISKSTLVSSLAREGQMLPDVVPLMRGNAWSPDKEIPWQQVKEIWRSHWDLDRPLLLEKSPPNLMRAAEIEAVFRPARFVAMIRDPYAFCEGRARRHNSTLEEAATFWVRCAEQQIRNIEQLEHIVWFTYEQFVEQTHDSLAKVESLFDGLRLNNYDIDANAAPMGRVRSGALRNLNGEKIDLLSNGQIDQINAVLRTAPEVMRFFGYNYLTPEPGRQLRHYKAVIRNLSRPLERVFKRALSKGA